MSKNTRTRILLVAVASLLLVTMAVGGTLAWLVDSTTPVINEFTASGIDISLEETEQNWTMQLIPGTEKEKDPIVSVEKTTTVDIILFVKFENSAPDCLTYTSTLATPDWTYDTTNDVWYRLVAANDVKAEFDCTEENCEDTTLHWHMLEGDIVSVANTVTKDATNATGSMTWTAWAIQQTGFVEDGAVTNVTEAFKLAQSNGSYATSADIPTT